LAASPTRTEEDKHRRSGPAAGTRLSDLPAMTPPRLSSKADYDALLDKYDTWLFDCDGVLWSGDHVLEGVTDVLGLLRRRGKVVLFVTNNATKSRVSYKKKFDGLGVQAHVVRICSTSLCARERRVLMCTQDEIFGSSYATAVYLSSVLKLPKDKKVFVIGQDGLEAELAAEGIAYIGGTVRFPNPPPLRPDADQSLALPPFRTRRTACPARTHSRTLRRTRPSPLSSPGST
jgi:hypothetical protein